MFRKTVGLFLVSAIAVSLVSGARAATASAAAWYFDEVELEGTESIANSTPGSLFSVPGLTFGCEPLPLEMTIQNFPKKGTGSVIELPVGTCFAYSSVCTVEAFSAEGFPWASHLATVGGVNYLVIEGFNVTFLFGGVECPLYETPVEISGSAGGLFDNATGTIAFSPSSFKATGTQLKAFGQKVEWNAVLAMRATGFHGGEALTVK